MRSRIIPGGAGMASVPVVPGGGVPKAYLIIFTDIGNEATIVNLSGSMKIGRQVPGNEPDIAIDSPIVSRVHGELVADGKGYYYRDLDSFNGTFINGVLFKEGVNPCKTPIQLQDGDVIRIDNIDKRKSHDNAVTMIFSTNYDKRSKWKRVKHNAGDLSIGLSAKKLIEFESSKMQWQNAIVTKTEVGCSLRPTSNRNNVRYNNKVVTGPCYVRDKDVFRVDDNYIYHDKGQLLYSVCLVTEPGLDIRLAETSVTDKMKKKVLLKDINLNIDKG